MTSASAGFDDPSVFRALFAANPDALLVADANGTIVLANPSATALLGYGGDELLGLNVDALVPDSIRPRHAAYRKGYAKQPRPRPMGMQMDLVAKRKDGSEVMVEIALSPLQGHGGPLVVAAIRDIGAYPRVKQALQRARYSEHLAQLGRLAVDARDPHALLEPVPRIAAAALEVDAAQVYLLEHNGLELRIAAASGAVGDEAVGAHVANRADTPAGLVLAQRRPLNVPDLRIEEHLARTPADRGAGILSVLAVPLSDRGRDFGVLVVRSRELKRFGSDELHFLESLANLLATGLQRAQSEEALNHAQRLESVGQLTGGIAHDFNNLLTVIQGNLQVLEELPALANDHHAQQLVGAAARASRRGAELTGKLLAFSRRQVLQPTTVDVPAMLQSLADMLRRTLDQHIAIEVDVAPCPPCLADAGQLESALLNIAINARDAMPGGGRLRFEARPCAGLPEGIQADDVTAAEAAFVAIAIADTGTGMSEKTKERAFEPFFTTKEAGRGTGLGLSTVYGFVKQSKGAIAIDSAVGSGTTVTLYIPRIALPAVRGPATEADGRIPAGLRVLLVEDDPDVRSVVRTFLDTLGCEVASASSGEQALGLLDAADAFDVLLTDIALGAGIRGTDLAAQAQQRFPQLGILLMSGFSTELLRADGSAPPSWELLRKPYSRAELARAIGRVINA